MRNDWPGRDGDEMVLRVDGGMVASDWTMQHLADILDAPNENDYETVEADHVDMESEQEAPKNVDLETGEILNEEGQLNL